MDVFIYTQDGQNLRQFNEFPEWNDNYLQYVPAKVFERCGSTSFRDPSAWSTVSVSTLELENSCIGVKN